MNFLFIKQTLSPITPFHWVQILLKKRSMARTALPSDAIISLVFGIFMAIIALLALWQTAYYAARSMRGLHTPLYH